MTPLSSDPTARAASLANLRPGSPGLHGNAYSRTHGGYAAVARERLEAKELEVYDAISADAPLRDVDGGLPSHDAAAVALLAQCLCRLEDVSANIRDFGLFDQKTGSVRPAVDLEGKLRREAAGYLDTLGMTPKARAALGLDLVRAGQATISDELNAAREAREARQSKVVDAEIAPDDEGGAA